MTSIDLALNTISLKIEEGIFINISLYDLKDVYNQTDNSFLFFIEFTEEEDNFQLG